MRLYLFIPALFVFLFSSECARLSERALEYADICKLLAAVCRGIRTSEELAGSLSTVDTLSLGGNSLKKLLMKSKYDCDWRKKICGIRLCVEGDDVEMLSNYFSKFGLSSGTSEIRAAEKLEEHFIKCRNRSAAEAKKGIFSAFVMLACGISAVVIFVW